MGPFLNTLLTTLGVWIPRIIAALVILLIGWIIAKIVAAIVRKIVGLLKIDARLGKSLEGSDTKMPSLERVIVGIFYWVIMIFAIIAALNALGMTQIAAFFTAFLTPFFAYLPQLAAGVILALIAWLVATILRGIVVRLLHGVGIDKKVNDQADMGALPISGAIGEAVYWLVWLLFLPGILGVLGLAGLAVPVQNMINDLLGLPAQAAGRGDHPDRRYLRRPDSPAHHGFCAPCVRRRCAERPGGVVPGPGQAEPFGAARLHRLHHRVHPGGDRRLERARPDLPGRAAL